MTTKRKNQLDNESRDDVIIEFKQSRCVLLFVVLDLMLVLDFDNQLIECLN